MSPEEVLEAINAALPHFHGRAPSKPATYRFCIENLRRLRLLLEDFPKNHNLILVGQVELLSNLDLAVNQDIDLMLLCGHDFLPAVMILEGWLEEYRRDLGQRPPAVASSSSQPS